MLLWSLCCVDCTLSTERHYFLICFPLTAINIWEKGLCLWFLDISLPEHKSWAAQRVVGYWRITSCLMLGHVPLMIDGDVDLSNSCLFPMRKSFYDQELIYLFDLFFTDRPFVHDFVLRLWKQCGYVVKKQTRNRESVCPIYSHAQHVTLVSRLNSFTKLTPLP